EKIQLADSFEVRDLVQKERYTKEYFVLLVGSNQTRLFKAKEKQFREFNDKNFPSSYDGIDYEIPVPENQGNNAAQAMKRETGITTQSTREFYNVVDQKLLEYLTDQSLLIVAGADKHLSDYYHHTLHQDKIKGK